MTPDRRRKYLNALGIDAWRPRAAGPAAQAEAEAPPPPVAQASIVATPAPRPLPARTARAKPEKTPAIRETAAAYAPPAADVPADWAGLRAMVRDCTRCKLCGTRTQTVFGVGVADAPLMVVGEGPGADEDALGEPFVGRAGKLLDEMLKAIGRSRGDNVFIANVVKCRPPGNRDPEADEVEACRPYLDRQIELVRPKLIVGLGRIAAQRLLSTDEPLSKLRGPLHHIGAARTPLFITYHPAYLLRSPREKAKSWEDLKKIHRFLAAAPSV